MAPGVDEDADMALVHHVLDTMPLDPSKNTAAQRAFELLYRVNAFILWNGFDGYFDHGNLAEVSEVLEALRLIGAGPYIELLSRAASAAGQREELDEVNSAYYECPDDFYGYMARYAREHPEAFPVDGA